MKLAVDMHILEGPPQGSRRYLEELYRCVLTGTQTEEDRFEFWYGRRNTDIESRFPPSVKWRTFNTDRRVVRLGWAANSLIRESRPDWINFTYVLPLIKTCKEAVTIHDILFETHPEYFSTPQRTALKLFVSHAARRADLVVTISEFSRITICDRYGVDPDKVIVTPCGVDATKFHSYGREEAARAIFETYGLSDFLLSVGRIDHRKNLVALVEAYSLARSRNRSLPRLVIVGPPGNALGALREVITRHGLEGSVVHLNQVSDEHLPLFYRAAQGFLFPSWAEGFGIPVLEAMASGCPVACSSGTALRELIDGGRGIELDPGSVDSMVVAIEALSSSYLNSPMTETAMKFANSLSWEKSATIFKSRLGLTSENNSIL